jgi:ADP-heptose:LPS heptosyltransferase
LFENISFAGLNGDILCLTIAVESLVKSYPDKYDIFVQTSCDQIWQHNPHVKIIPWTSPVPDGVRVIDCTYSTINRSSQEPWRMLEGYTHDLGTYLGVPLHPRINKPCVYLTEEELSWMSLVQQHFTHKTTKYVLFSPASKRDYTNKNYPSSHWQKIIDHFAGTLTFVQIGSKDANNPKLNNCLNAVGMTDHRQFLRLVAHKDCLMGLGCITYLMHACAAFEKPYILLNGGREPTSWVTGYRLQHTISSVGLLPCSGHGCWRSRVVPIGDGDKKDSSLCEQPVLHLGDFPSPRCMAMIEPTEVCHAVERILRFS